MRALAQRAAIEAVALFLAHGCGLTTTDPRAFLALEGTVTDLETGLPIAAAEIDLVVDGPTPFCPGPCSVVGAVFGSSRPHTDATGAWSLSGALTGSCDSVADWYLEVSANGYETYRSDYGVVQCVRTAQTFHVMLERST